MTKEHVVVEPSAGAFGLGTVIDDERATTVKTRRQIRPTAAILVALLVLPLLPPGFAAASFELSVVPAAHALPTSETRSVFVTFADGTVDDSDFAALEELGLTADNVTMGRDGMASIELPANSDATLFAGALEVLPEVEIAIPGGVLSILEGATTPDDDFYATRGRFVRNDYRDALVEVYQRQYMGPQALYPHSLQFEPAWSSIDAEENEPVRIAVLDTGYSSPDSDVAAGTIIAMGDYTRRNPVTGDPIPTVADGHGHGTMVASTIAATVGNAQGVAGATGGLPVEVLVYKVLRDDGTSRIEGALDINEAIMDAVDDGADVINCSFGDTAATRDDLGEAFRPAVDYALAHDVIVVAAAGNTGADYVLPPAAVADVVAVGSIDYVEGTLSAFSNHGRGLDLVATGEDLPVLAPATSDVSIAHGTSFATPLVSAAFALLRHADPDATARELIDAVLASADPYPSAGSQDSVAYGSGKLDVLDAINELAEGDADASSVALMRHAGSSRYDTAATVSRTTFPQGAPAAVLASGEGWADALSAGVLAQAVDGPLLLVGPDALPSATARELKRLAPSELIVVGGPRAVDPDVLESVRAVLPGVEITRLAGADRYATARAVAAETATRGGLFGNTAVLASGHDFPDALAAVPVAARSGWPILLTAPDALAIETRQLIDGLGITDVVLVGGTSAVGAQVADALAGRGLHVERVAGRSRYETARAVADWAIDRGILSEASLGVATGMSFPDALSGGPFMAEVGGPLILADDVDGGLNDWLAGHPGFERLHVFGGTGVVSAPVATGIVSSLESR